LCSLLWFLAGLERKRREDFSETDAEDHGRLVRDRRCRRSARPRAAAGAIPRPDGPGSSALCGPCFRQRRRCRPGPSDPFGVAAIYLSYGARGREHLPDGPLAAIEGVCPERGGSACPPIEDAYADDDPQHRIFDLDHCAVPNRRRGPSRSDLPRHLRFVAGQRLLPRQPSELGSFDIVDDEPADCGVVSVSV